MRALLIAGLLVALGCGKKQDAEAPGGGNPAPKYTKLTVDELADEWALNPLAASDKYKRDGVELTGELEGVNTNKHGQTFASVKGRSAEYKRKVQVFVLSDAARDGLKVCVVGKPVVVRGKTDGETADHPRLIADDVAPAP